MPTYKVALTNLSVGVQRQNNSNRDCKKFRNQANFPVGSLETSERVLHSEEG